MWTQPNRQFGKNVLHNSKCYCCVYNGSLWNTKHITRNKNIMPYHISYKLVLNNNKNFKKTRKWSWNEHNADCTCQVCKITWHIFICGKLYWKYFIPETIIWYFKNISFYRRMLNCCLNLVPTMNYLFFVFF